MVSMNINKEIRCLFYFFFFFIIPLSTIGYGQTIDYRGIVIGEDSLPIANAAIQLLSNGLNIYSNDSGTFLLTNQSTSASFHSARPLVCALTISNNLLSFSLNNGPAKLRIVLLDTKGRLVATLKELIVSSGIHAIDLSLHNNIRVAQGVYIMSITIGTFNSQIKALLFSNHISFSNISKVSFGDIRVSSLRKSADVTNSIVDTLCVTKPGYLSVKRPIISYSCAMDTALLYKELLNEQKDTTAIVYSSINHCADSVLQTKGIMRGFQSIVSAFKGTNCIDSIWISTNALIVSFHNCGLAAWPIDTTAASSSMANMTLRKTAHVTSSTVLGKACVLNGALLSPIPLQTSFTELDNFYTVDQPPVDGFTTNFITTQLARYSVVFINAHGMDFWPKDKYNDNTYVSSWVITGEGYFTQGYPDWLGYLKNHADDSRAWRTLFVGGYVAISNHFIDYYLRGQSFPTNSLVYSSSCYFLRNPSEMGGSFILKGVKSVLGWDNLSCENDCPSGVVSCQRACPAGVDLISSMLTYCKTVDAAFSDLPIGERQLVCGGVQTNLNYFPSGSSTFQLRSDCKPQVTLLSPPNGSIIDTLLPYGAKFKWDTHIPLRTLNSIQVSSDSKFSSLVVDYVQITSSPNPIDSIDINDRPNGPVGSISNGATFFWRVRSTPVDSAGIGWGGWSEVWSFTTQW